MFKKLDSLIKTSLSPRKIDGLYSPKEVQPIINTALKDTSFDDCLNFLLREDTQDTPHLVNPIARILVEKDKDKSQELLERDNLSPSLKYYLKKHLLLGKNKNEYQEETIADILERKKGSFKIKVNEYGSAHRQHLPNIYVVKKALCLEYITSLCGLHLLEKSIDLSQIKEISITGNYIIATSPDECNTIDVKNWSHIKILRVTCHEVTRAFLSVFKYIDDLGIFENHGPGRTRIDSDAFHDLKQLKALHFNGCDFDSVSGTLFQNLTSLLELNIHSSSVLPSSLRNLFKNLRQLTHLNIHQSKGFEKLVSGMFEELEHLEILQIIGLWTEIEDGAFKGLDRLKELNLHENCVEKFTSGTFEGLRNLKFFYFGYNFTLSSIEEGAFKHFSNLEIFFLDCHRLKRIDQKWFAPLVSLKELHLEGGSKQQITNTFFAKYFPSIEYLDCQGMKFANGAEAPFANLKHLKELKLECCYLNQPNFNDFFKGLPFLKTLILEDITSKEAFGVEALYPLSNLKRLSLDNIRLSIKEPVNNGAISAKKLFLSYIDIENFPALLNKIPKLKHVTIHGIESKGIEDIDTYLRSNQFLVNENSSSFEYYKSPIVEEECRLCGYPW